MKEFGKEGYAATVSELSDNLIKMDAVDMLDKSRVTSDVYANALSYLMFLKRKRTSKVKARCCADGRPTKGIHIEGGIQFPYSVNLCVIYIVCYGCYGRKTGHHV